MKDSENLDKIRDLINVPNGTALRLGILLPRWQKIKKILEENNEEIPVNKSEPVMIETMTTGIVQIKIPARVLGHIIDKGYIKVKNGNIIDVLC